MLAEFYGRKQKARPLGRAFLLPLTMGAAGGRVCGMAKPPSSSLASVLALGIMAVLCCGICSGVLNAPHDSATASKPQAADKSLDGARFGEATVKRFLARPDDAHFPMFGATARETGIDGLWLVTGTVEAKNGFGMTLNQRWRVRMLENGDSWSLLSCEIDGEPVYGDPIAIPGR